MSILEKVKELRDITGAGIQDCKTALSENNEDIDLAIEFLRKKGIAKAAKKSTRGATEGLISMIDDLLLTIAIEINPSVAPLDDFFAALAIPFFLKNSIAKSISSLFSDRAVLQS